MFRNRTESGRELATALTSLGDTDPLVLALARGGVPVASEVAKRLGVSMDVKISGQGEIDRRLARSHDDQLAPSVAGRTVILVDGGIATGAIAQAALEVLRALGAKRNSPSGAGWRAQAGRATAQTCRRGRGS